MTRSQAFGDLFGFSLLCFFGFGLIPDGVQGSFTLGGGSADSMGAKDWIWVGLVHPISQV